jgi:hypothetical protein
MGALNGNMYEGVVTWNPLGGKCLHDCSYCSTNTLRRFPCVAEKYSGEIRLTKDVTKRFAGKPKTIFVAAQNDLFAEGVESGFIRRVLLQCHFYQQHTYLFQSKNPIRFMEFRDFYPEESIFCTTIETNRTYPQMGNTPTPHDRAMAMNDVVHELGNNLGRWKYQVTIEPIMDFDLEEMAWLIETCLPDQVNIGADSKRNNLPEPSHEQVMDLIDNLNKYTRVVNKRNLNRLLK